MTDRDLSVLSDIFRREVFRMLRSKGLLSEQRLSLLRSWRHSGFHVHIGAPLDPRSNQTAFEGLARYLVRAPIRHAQLVIDPDRSDHAELAVDSDHDPPSDATVVLRLQRPDQVSGAPSPTRSTLSSASCAAITPSACQARTRTQL